MTKKPGFQEVRNCKYDKCGIEFTAKRRNQFYHAPKCKQADWHKNNFSKTKTIVHVSDPALPFSEDSICRNDLPRDVFLILHDLCYWHEGQDVNSYIQRAQAALMAPGACFTSAKDLLKVCQDFIAEQTPRGLMENVKNDLDIVLMSFACTYLAAAKREIDPETWLQLKGELRTTYTESQVLRLFKEFREA